MAPSGDRVVLQFYANCAFQWTSPQGIRVVVDPWHNEEGWHWFIHPFPELEADVLLITHPHFDHNAPERITGNPTVLRGPGRFALGDVTITGAADYHALPRWSWMRNTMFVVETAGVRFCHIGDNRGDIPHDVLRAIGAVDVLMVTVDDTCHLLSFDEVATVVERFNPRVVIPTHYYAEGINVADAPLKTPEGWLVTQEKVRHLEEDALSLGREDLPPSREVWAMRPIPPTAG